MKRSIVIIVCLFVATLTAGCAPNINTGDDDLNFLVESVLDNPDSRIEPIDYGFVKVDSYTEIAAQVEELNAQVESLQSELKNMEVEPPPPNTFKNKTNRDTTCPFLAELPFNSGNYHYLVFKNVSDGKTACSLFLHPEGSKEINVPVGSYHIFISSGKTWYGEENAFGSEGQYSRLDDVFKFQTSGNLAHGHTITLYETFDGNLDEIPIDVEAFLK